MIQVNQRAWCATGKADLSASRTRQAIAGAIERLATDTACAAAMGDYGARSIADITWSRVGKALASALGMEGEDER